VEYQDGRTGELYVRETYRHYNGKLSTVNYEDGWREHYQYNQDGYLVKESFSNTVGSIIRETTYKYSDQHQLLLQTEYNALSNTKTEYEYTYDINNNPVSRKIRSYLAYAANGSALEPTVSPEIDRHWVYDSKGNLLEESFYDLDGTVCRQTHYTYDDAGRKIQEEHLQDGNRTVTVWTFDETGRKHTETTGSQIREWTYDTKGNMLTELVVEGDSYTLTTWFYDKKDRVIAKEVVRNDREEPERNHTRSEWEYNNNGLLVCYRYYESDALKTGITYTYTSITLPRHYAELARSQQQALWEKLQSMFHSG
jgi:hypothetical protein